MGSSSEKNFHQIDLIVFFKPIFLFLSLSFSVLSVCELCLKHAALLYYLWAPNWGNALWQSKYGKTEIVLRYPQANKPENLIPAHCFISLKRRSLSVVTLTSRSFFSDRS